MTWIILIVVRKCTINTSVYDVNGQDHWRINHILELETYSDFVNI
jgi:hypothetical protein